MPPSTTRVFDPRNNEHCQHLARRLTDLSEDEADRAIDRLPVAVVIALLKCLIKVMIRRTTGELEMHAICRDAD
jgi:hypothetical protein